MKYLVVSSRIFVCLQCSQECSATWIYDHFSHYNKGSSKVHMHHNTYLEYVNVTLIFKIFIGPWTVVIIIIVFIFTITSTFPKKCKKLY